MSEDKKESRVVKFHIYHMEGASTDEEIRQIEEDLMEELKHGDPSYLHILTDKMKMVSEDENGYTIHLAKGEALDLIELMTKYRLTRSGLN